MTDPLGRVMRYAYDELGRLSTTSPDPDGEGAQESSETTYIYDHAGNRIGVTDALGNTTRYVYDVMNRVTDIFQPDPDGETNDPYDGVGDFDDLENYAAGAIHTSLGYNLAGQLASVTIRWAEKRDDLRIRRSRPAQNQDASCSADSPVYLYAYDDAGNLRYVTAPDPNDGDPDGVETEFQYDERNRLTHRIEEVGGEDSTTVYQYYANGQLQYLTDPAERVTTYAYDETGWLTNVTGPDPDNAPGGDEPASMAYAYDALGNLLATTDALGYSTFRVYDYGSRLVADYDQNMGATTYGHDLVGNLLSLTDPVGARTDYAYDGLNRLVSETNYQHDAGQGAGLYAFPKLYTYDAMGNVTRIVDREERDRDFEYDNNNRLNHEYWYTDSGAADIDTGRTEAENTINYTYNKFGQVATAVDDNTNEEFLYNEGLLSEFHDHAHEGLADFYYRYDALGRRTAQYTFVDHSALDFTNEYQYDGLNRLTQVLQHEEPTWNPVAEKRFDFTYKADSQLDTIARYASLNTSAPVADSVYGYDDAGRLNSLAHTAADTTPIAGYEWEYDAANRVTTFNNSVHTGENKSYVNDPRGQLTEDGATEYTYDANGNRTITDYETGDINQLTADGTYHYEYDRDGNLKTRMRDSDDFYTVYIWDHRNRLIEVHELDDSDVPLAHVYYTYDALDHRVVKQVDADADDDFTSVGDVDEWYIYDGNDVVLTLDANDSYSVKDRYLHAAGMVLADEQWDPVGTDYETLWLFGDNQGTIRDVTETDGTVLDHVTYDGFGQATGHTSGVGPITVYGYAAGVFDIETGLSYFWHRYYDASTGRWLSQDPIGFGGGPNDYIYVHNSPANGVDPSGLDWLDTIANAAAGFGDAISFGLATDKIRDSANINGGIDHGSAVYIGGEVAGVGVSIGINGGVGLGKAVGGGILNTTARGIYTGTGAYIVQKDCTIWRLAKQPRGLLWSSRRRPNCMRTSMEHLL